MSTKSFHNTGAALDAMAGFVASAKTDDPFARITILVPSHASGLDVTRHLARRSVNGSLSGTVAVEAVTVAELAEQLFQGSAAARGRQALPLPLRQGAIAMALKDNPGLFRQVWDQPATAKALAATSEYMDGVDLAAPGLPALPTLVAEVWKLHQEAMGTTSSTYYTNADVLTGAASAVSSEAAELGLVIGFMLPESATALEARFLASVEALPGYSSVSAAGTPTSSMSLMTASDSDDETRAAVRKVTELVAGTPHRPAVPAHRIGLFYTASDPYRTLVTRRLDEAGITYSGPESAQLADMPIARGITTLLRLAPEKLDVRAVLNILAEGAVHWAGQEVPSSTVCERLYLSPFEEDESSEPDAEEPGYATRRRVGAQQFEAFLAALADRLAAIHASTSWSSAESVLTEFVMEFFGPRSEQEMPVVTSARESLLEIMGTFAAFDGVAPAPVQGSLAATLESAIAGSQSRRGKIGTGVNVGPLRDGVGRDLDVVIVLGLVEGLAPSKVLEDPLFPDTVKAAHGTGLPTIDQRIAAQAARFKELLSTADETFLFAPRGNLRGGGSYELSRWVSADESETLRPTVVPSFDHGVRTGAGTVGGLPPTAQEWGIRNALGAPGGVSSVADSVLATALEIRRHRRQGQFGRFTGDLSAHSGSLIDLSRAISPSSLEDWVSNPFGYFLKRVLRVGLFEDLDLELQIGPAQRGEMVHRALENYVQAVIEGSPATVETLEDAMQPAFTEGANPAWLPHLWARDRAIMAQTLLGVLAADQSAADEGWSYLAPEAGFGPSVSHFNYDYVPVPVDLPGGLAVTFQGKVDRIDKNSDGRVRIYDYKTGHSKRFGSIKHEDPTVGGTKFQLPVYGLFAQQFREDPETPVRAEYWFVREGAAFVGYDVDDQVLERFGEDAAVVLHGIGSGVFPHIPESGSFLTYTSVAGQPSVAQAWRQLRTHRTICEFPMLVEATDGK